MADVRRLQLAYNNVYIVNAGEEPVLIDTGPDYRGAWETLNGWLEGRRPSHVLVSHGHHDHASLGAAWLRAGVPVAVGAGDERLVRGPQLQSDEELGAFTRFVEDSGAPEDVCGEAVAGLALRRSWALRAARAGDYPDAGRGARWPTGLRYEPFEPGPMPEMTGGVEAILSPGHTPGNQVFAVRSEGWLFSGDQLLPDITPTPAIQARAEPDWAGDWRFHSLPEFVRSLRRLRELGLTRCYPGHGEPFENVAGAIDENLAVIERRTERVLAALREDGPATLFRLTERIYPRGAGRRFWQVVATVQGHLDLLEARGEAACRRGRWEAGG